MEHRSFAPDIVVPNDDYACGNKRAGELAPDVAPEELRQEKQVGGPVNCSDSELCTFLLALEAGFLPTYYSDTNQSVQLKSMSIASKSYRRGKQTVLFHGFPSLQMSQNFMDDHGKGLSMLSVEDFPARTSVSPEPARAWQGNGRAYGRKWQGLLARYDHDSRSLKTAQCSFLEDSISFLPILPRSGLMLRGECYQRQTLAHRTSGGGFGSLLPTVTTQDNAQFAGQYANPKSGTTLGGYVLMYPTCTIDSATNRTGNYAQGVTLLTAAVFRTPCANDGGKWSNQSAEQRMQKGQQVMLSHQIGAHGRLNPEFCEWLMGWPIGWTGLKPLETGKFHEWQQQHSSSLPQSLSEAT